MMTPRITDAGLQPGPPKVEFWAAQYEGVCGGVCCWIVRVFDSLTDCDAFREKMWAKGIDPEYWLL